MAVVLLKIIEEAYLSGELKLSGRKLKDFPKAAAKYNLSDTVIADLSRNRFCELPEDVAAFPFLETLLMYHNTLRSIPETIRGLHSLSFLDLRSNLLTVLPRELCFLPIQVLLVSNNRLVSLPEELGRMEQLTELDAACNQITHLPARMSDLRNLRSLSLRNNHLVYLPRDVTCLNLVSLDISGNRIATLPVELRLMTNLVSLHLDSNPLTSPPASLCVRGLVHVFKFLDTMATKEEKSRTDGNATLRRNAAAKQNAVVSEIQKIRRQHVDSGYSTSDGLDKRWSQELPQNGNTTDINNSKWSPKPLHIRTTVNERNSPTGTTTSISTYQPQTKSGSSTPALSPAGNNNLSLSTSNNGDEFKRPAIPVEISTPKRYANGSNGSHSNSNDASPDGDHTPESQKSDDKLKSLGNIQTYRAYKEALRQQRIQDSSAIYKPKDPNQTTPPDGVSPQSTSESSTSTASMTLNSSSGGQMSPISPLHSNSKYSPTGLSISIASNGSHNNGAVDAVNNSLNSNGSSGNGLKSPIRTDKPIQKVIPSRNSTPIKYQQPQQVSSPTNGNQPDGKTKEYGIYAKPTSPSKPASSSINGTLSLATSAIKSNGSNKNGPKVTRNVSWNRDVPAEKLSFTMRREFDRQKEESELIEQLRTIIESRLKMSLPKDVASALTDGVVLCHLANHVRPRSVASIHVPSPAVPKLTMARCRRNVDNFLDACRKIGVDEELICSCADIVPSDEPHSSASICDGQSEQTPSKATVDRTSEKSSSSPAHVVQQIVLPPNPSAMFRTIAALVEHREPVTSNRSTSSSYATNTKTRAASREEYDNYNNYFKTVGIHFQRTPNLLWQQATRVDHQHNEYNLIDDFVAINEFVDSDVAASYRNNQLCSDTNRDEEEDRDDDDDDDDNNQQYVTRSGNDYDICHYNNNGIQNGSDSNSGVNNNNYNRDNSSANGENDNNVNNEWPEPQRKNRKTPNTLDLNLSNTTNPHTTNTLTLKKRKLSNNNNKRNINQMVSGKYTEQIQLNGIVEECEYDSDIGKFNCKINGDQLPSDNSSGSIEFTLDNSSSTSSFDDRFINDLNSSPKQKHHQSFERNSEQFNIDGGEMDCSKKMILKRIEFFENAGDVKRSNIVFDGKDECDSPKGLGQAFLEKENMKKDKQFSSILCLSTFVLTVIVLYCFPLPN